jgi:hypothetical protein
MRFKRVLDSIKSLNKDFHGIFFLKKEKKERKEKKIKEREERKKGNI